MKIRIPYTVWSAKENSLVETNPAKLILEPIPLLSCFCKATGKSPGPANASFSCFLQDGNDLTNPENNGCAVNLDLFGNVRERGVTRIPQNRFVPAVNGNNLPFVSQRLQIFDHQGPGSESLRSTHDSDRSGIKENAQVFHE
jgi:hypothetical protein